MSKLLFIFAAALTGTSALLAMRAVNDLPQRVDAGETSLRMRIEGNGTPTVVLEIGLGGALEEWAAVQPEVAKFAKVVAYDRMGSKQNSQILTGRQVAMQLHTALINAHLFPPYVLVGQSFGGVYNQVFVGMYPDEVVGMILLDSPTEDFALWMREHHPDEDFTRQHHNNWPEATGVLPTFAELKELGQPPDVPVKVVTATRRPDDAEKAEILAQWKSAHEALAKHYPQGQHIVTEKSGHGIQVEQPDLVVDLIRQVVLQARMHKPGGGDHGDAGKSAANEVSP